jgi:hypothetical protein
VGSAWVRGDRQRLRDNEEGVGVPWWGWVLIGLGALVLIVGVPLGVMAWLEVRAASGKDSDSTS